MLCLCYEYYEKNNMNVRSHDSFFLPCVFRFSMLKTTHEEAYIVFSQNSFRGR